VDSCAVIITGTAAEPGLLNAYLLANFEAVAGKLVTSQATTGAKIDSDGCATRRALS